MNPGGVKPAQSQQDHDPTLLNHLIEWHGPDDVKLHAKFILLQFRNPSRSDEHEWRLLVTSKNLDSKKEIHEQDVLVLRESLTSNVFAQEFTWLLSMLSQHGAAPFVQLIDLERLGTAYPVIGIEEGVPVLATKGLLAQFKDEFQKSEHILLSNSIMSHRIIQDLSLESKAVISIFARRSAYFELQNLQTSIDARNFKVSLLKASISTQDYWMRQSYHAKVSIFSNAKTQSKWVGSPNLTIGGLQRNLELVCKREWQTSSRLPSAEWIESRGHLFESYPDRMPETELLEMRRLSNVRGAAIRAERTVRQIRRQNFLQRDLKKKLLSSDTIDRLNAVPLYKTIRDWSGSILVEGEHLDDNGPVNDEKQLILEFRDDRGLVFSTVIWKL